MIGIDLTDKKPKTIQKAKQELAAAISKHGWDVSAYKFMVCCGYDPINKQHVLRLEAMTYGDPFNLGVSV